MALKWANEQAPESVQHAAMVGSSTVRQSEEQGKPFVRCLCSCDMFRLKRYRSNAGGRLEEVQLLKYKYDYR